MDGVLNNNTKQKEVETKLCLIDLLTLPASGLFQEDIGEEHHHTGRQRPDDTLVDGDDILQGVDAFLHGTSVNVVINGGADAPHRPHDVHQGFHGGRDHRKGPTLH